MRLLRPCLACWLLALGPACGGRAPPLTPKPQEPASAAGRDAAPAARAGATGESAPPAGASHPGVAPYRLQECVVLSHNYGNWRPTRHELLGVASQLATGLCYNYWEIDPRKFAASVEACLQQTASTTVRLVVPFASPVQGACDVEFRAVAWNDRRWLWSRSFYQRGAYFGAQLDMVELRAEGLQSYATQLVCAGDRQHAMAAESPPVESGSVSPALLADWVHLPRSLRAFVCTGDPLGDNLSQAD